MEDVARVVPGAVASGISPAITVDVTVPDDANKEALDQMLLAAGYAFVGVGDGAPPPPPTLIKDENGKVVELKVDAAGVVTVADPAVADPAVADPVIP